jgi:penicillin-insensitive murein endopeptidase
MKFILLILLFLPLITLAEISTCYGTTSKGHLQKGVQLPSKGKNFVGYSAIGHLTGRTYVHSELKDIIISAYKELETEQPDKIYKYAETGFKLGGEFKPHKTHRNGLSVDFMTPVIDENGQSVHLPTNLMNKFGYDIEFDEQDKYKGMRIDYTAIAAHIVALHKQAKKRGYDLWRVIFDPVLQPNLFATQYAGYLKDNITFSNKRSWVRHDEHYHVDFSIPCQ